MPQIYAIIDDDQDDVDILCEAVAALKPTFDCLTFINPVEALQSLEKSMVVPAYIFVDYNMPFLNGKQVVARLRGDKRFENSVLTVISTGISDADAKIFTDMGADHVYRKPYTMKDYVTILLEVMRDI